MREGERGWEEGSGWRTVFGPSFTLSGLAGDSVQDLLITTQWSSNPEDLIDSYCWPGITALPNHPSVLSLPQHLSSQTPLPSPPSLIKHWYAWQPRGPMKEGVRVGEMRVHCHRKRLAKRGVPLGQNETRSISEQCSSWSAFCHLKMKWKLQTWNNVCKVLPRKMKILEGCFITQQNQHNC